MPFRAIYLDTSTHASTPATPAVRVLDDASLPRADAGPIIVDVAYSTINYKDALAIVKGPPVVRTLPMIPGIDLAGTVRTSDDPEWPAGRDVVINGWGLGETHWGGLAERASVRPDWLIGRPATMTLFETMAIGTAGYTAALSVAAIERHGVVPANGPVLVTGATGGVGSVAIMLLSAAGFHVVASTGKRDADGYLRRLGAREIIDRALLSEPGKPLQPERWAAAVDSLGSQTLVNACAATRAGGVVAACGLAEDMAFPGTVAPFILRGITLVGINSVTRPRADREAAWRRLESSLDRAIVAKMAAEIGLDEAIAAAGRTLAGRVTGRVVVNVSR